MVKDLRLFMCWCLGDLMGFEQNYNQIPVVKPGARITPTKLIRSNTVNDGRFRLKESAPYMFARGYTSKKGL